MSSPFPIPKPRWWQKRRVWLIAAFLGFAALTPFAVPVYQDWQLDRELAALLAETDRLDPGWRWEEMQAKRPKIADAENAYPLLVKIEKLMPVSQTPKYTDLILPEELQAGTFEHQTWIWDIYTSIERLPDEKQLNPQQITALQSEWKRYRQGYAEASRLREFRHCEFPDGKRYPESLSTCRRVASLVQMKTLLDCQEERLDDALREQEVIRAINRFLGENADSGSHLVKLATIQIMCDSLKRVLGQGEATAEQLRAAQSALRKEEEDLRLTYLMRIVRAEAWKGWVDLMKAPLSEQVETMKMVSSLKKTLEQEKKEPLPWYLAWLKGERLEDPRRAALEDLKAANRWVEFANLSYTDQDSRIGLLEKHGWMQATYSKYNTAHRRVLTALMTTRTALALERHRLAKGDWPKSLDQLVPKFLAEVPTDLFTGKSLIYRLVERGAIVYSVGVDKTDNGGKLRPDADMVGTNGLDIGVRLWDPPHRRQPPLPPVLPRPKDE